MVLKHTALCVSDKLTLFFLFLQINGMAEYYLFQDNLENKNPPPIF